MHEPAILRRQLMAALHMHTSADNALHLVIEQYAFPAIGELPIEAIELGDITRILEPIGTTKTETATRVRQRIEGCWPTRSPMAIGPAPTSRSS